MGILASPRGWLVLLHFLQELLDALGVLLGKVQREMQLRHAPERQPLDQFAPDESRSMLERLDRVGSLLLASLHADENARVFHIRLDAHFAGDHVSFQPRILQRSEERRVGKECRSRWSPYH